MKAPIIRYEKGVEIVIGEIDTETGEKTMFDEKPAAQPARPKKDAEK